MMAKRELSSTLKNLKFMQRASQKEEKANDKEKEVTPTGDFPSSSAIKRCVVIYEGDPHPGAARGRMSFLSFNPSIDKLNDEKCDASETESTATNSGRKSEATSVRKDSPSEDGIDSSESEDHKRKQADFAMEAPYPKKSKKTLQATHYSSPSTSHSSQKHEKLDWNVLNPAKYQNKRR